MVRRPVLLTRGRQFLKLGANIELFSCGSATIKTAFHFQRRRESDRMGARLAQALSRNTGTLV